eukprot:scaffold12982_cov129-Cylindrotheca_fusiformis.AAC.8
MELGTVLRQASSALNLLENETENSRFRCFCADGSGGSIGDKGNLSYMATNDVPDSQERLVQDYWRKKPN